jgi:phage terminase large subunit-like protein
VKQRSGIGDRDRDYLLANPAVFLSRYFPDKLYGRIEQFHLDIITASTTSKRGLILCPAAHGKTTLVSTLLPIWAVCKDPNVRVALILKNDIDAKGVMQAIQGEMLGNHELMQDWGPFRADNMPWALEKLWTAKRTRRDKNATISAYGAGSRNALGHRADWAICDDVVTDLNSATPERRAKLKEWFMQGPRTMPEDEDDRITVIGTLFDPEDLYNDLLELADPETGVPIWDALHKDAIVDEEEHTTLWPDRWPWRRLMELKAEMGTLDFNKRLRNIAVDPSRMVFREEYVKGGYIKDIKYPGCVDRQYKVGDYDSSWPRYAGFDPAIGTYRGAKFCAHVTIAVGSCAEHERCYWVVDLIRDQMSLPQQVELILSQHQLYDTFVSRVEANSYQAGLLDACEREMKEQGVAFKIEPHYTTRTNKPDPELGVQSMSRVFENGEVHIPWGNPESMRKMGQFVDELIQYPSGRTTDTVMAFWFAWRACQERMPLFKTFNRLHDGANKEFWRRQTKRRTIKNPYYADLKAS